MNAVFSSEQYTINNRTVYLNYLTTNHRDLTMVYSDKYISAEDFYGINGTFFDHGNGNLTSVAIQDGEQIRPCQPNCVNIPKEFTNPSHCPRANRAYRG